ncbi:recombinase family protein [Paenibacillus sp. NRS-1760]|uniref:recombinase family protein n=1 Tax=Paenibacillus sp. NRS-1760 TaxID=3233902 RepID=UPI003D2A8F84
MVIKLEQEYVALYVRVSTAQQVDNTSLDEQIALCRKLAIEKGYTDSNIRIYREEGATGEDVDVRPVMKKLREDVKAGIIRQVICTHPDRFSRDLNDKLQVVSELEKHGTDISFTDTEFEKSPEGKLFFNILSAIASYELGIIRKRTVRGRERAVRELKKVMPMRVAPFGYDKDSEGQLVINEHEAQYVKMIYEWYVFDNLTTRQIGEKLVSAGVMPKRGESNTWSASSIGRILSSEIYIGKYFYNRRRTKKIKGATTKTGNPKRSISYRDEEEWIEVEVPSIVDSYIFELAQNQKTKNITNKHTGNQTYQYLLKTILKCGHCGRTWDATTYSGREDKETGKRMKYRCYRCPNLAPKRYGEGIEKCQSESLRAELLEDYIWAEVIKLIADPKRFMEHLNAEASEGSEELELRLRLLQTQAQQYEKDKDKIKIMFRRDVITEQEMVEDLSKINSSLSSLEVEINKYHTQLQNRLQNSLATGTIEKLIKHVRTKLEHPETLTFDFKRHVITTLFDEIIVRFESDPDDGGKTRLIVTSIGTFDKLFKHNTEIAASIELGDDIGVRLQPQKIRQYWGGSRGFDLDRDDRPD